MAGTINISLSQQFDALGNPLAGGQLFFFEAATTTPQNAYKDALLTLAHPNPITLDSSGRVPAFYLADGNIRVRLEDSAGTVIFDESSLLVIGPSSGSGSGASIDSTTIFQTGDVMWLDVTGTRSGWVRDNGRTIGSATSGASERANADCESLFKWYWNNFSDTLCPVVGGRGSTASDDWAANKQITTRDRRGKVPAGLDDMGNSAAGVIAGGTPTVAGSGGGAETHTLTTDEIPSHNHTLTDPGHDHTFTYNAPQAAAGSGNITVNSITTSGASHSVDTSAETTGITLADTGGGGAHNIMQPYDLGTFYRKL